MEKKLTTARLHILVLSQYFSPEEFQINYLVELLLHQGHYVSVLTPHPSYPHKRNFTEYTRAISHPRLKTYRLPSVKRSSLVFSSSLSSLSFLLSSTLLGFLHIKRHRTDVILSPQYSPITCVFPAWFLSLVTRTPTILWIFDLWPHSLQVLHPVLYNVLSKIFFLLLPSFYQRFSHIYVSSPDFLADSVFSGHKKISHLPTWEPQSKFATLDIAFQKNIVISSIGHLGSPHDHHAILALIKASQSKPISFQFVGLGASMSIIQSYCTENHITNVRFLGLQSKQVAQQIASSSHYTLIPFLDSAVSCTLPFRAITSLSVATPLISTGNSYVSHLVDENNLGFNLNSSSTPSSYSNLLDHLLRLNQDAYSLLRLNCLNYHHSHCSPAAALSHLSLNPLLFPHAC